MNENCADCPVNTRADSLEKEFDRCRDGSSKTHREMFERQNSLEQAKTSLETKLDSIDAQLKKLVDYMETEKDKPNKLLDKLKENSIWLALAAVLGMVLARWGL